MRFILLLTLLQPHIFILLPCSPHTLLILSLLILSYAQGLKAGIVSLLLGRLALSLKDKHT